MTFLRALCRLKAPACKTVINNFTVAKIVGMYKRGGKKRRRGRERRSFSLSFAFAGDSHSYSSRGNYFFPSFTRRTRNLSCLQVRGTPDFEQAPTINCVVRSQVFIPFRCWGFLEKLVRKIGKWKIFIARKFCLG